MGRPIGGFLVYGGRVVILSRWRRGRVVVVRFMRFMITGFMIAGFMIAGFMIAGFMMHRGCMTMVHGCRMVRGL